MFLLLGFVEAGIASSITIEETCSELERLVENITWSKIFINNVEAMSIMVIPFIGPLYGFTTAFTTGTALNCVITQNELKGLYMIAIASSPVTYMELLAFSIVIVSSFMFSADVIRKRVGVVSLIDLVLCYLGAVVLLLLSAFLEEFLIKFLQ